MLSGLKLTWKNLMSYQIREVVISEDNVILGHYFFDPEEPIIIEELGLAFRKPKTYQNYPDGHKLVNYFDYRKDNAAVLLSREGIKKVKAAMKSEKPNIESWLKPYEEIFRERMGVEGFGSYLDFDTKFIPYIDPRENFKDINDNTHRHIADSMEKKKEGIIGGFKLEWWHIVVGVFGLAAILYVLNVI